MDAKIAQHVQILSCSASGENVLRSLQELNILMESRNISSEQLLILIPPSLLFRRLSLNHVSEIGHCCSLLKKLLNYMKPEIIIDDFKFEAMQGVNHPYVEVRELCLYQIQRCVLTNGGVLKVIPNTDLINFVVRNLGHSHMGCAKIASSILLSISHHGDGLALLLNSHYQAEFLELMQKSTTVCFRVYELFIKMFEANQNAYDQFKAIFTSLADEINNNDVLVQMNCIELLTDLINVNNVSYQFPEEIGFNQKLYSILTTADSSALETLLLPAIIKFFGFLSIKNPGFVLNIYPQFYNFVFHCITSNDATLLVVALDTIAAVGLSDEGLSAMFQDESKQSLMVDIARSLQTADEDIRVHCLDCLASLFSSSCSSDKNTLELIHSLYAKLDTNPLQLLFQLLKQPFNSVRKSCFKIIYNLASCHWFLADIRNIPGLIEFLLDRRTENDKECQELKYEVIKKMSLSPFISSTLDKPCVLKLKQFVRDGPFYVGSEVSVSIDENQ